MTNKFVTQLTDHHHNSVSRSQNWVHQQWNNETKNNWHNSLRSQFSSSTFAKHYFNVLVNLCRFTSRSVDYRISRCHRSYGWKTSSMPQVERKLPGWLEHIFSSLLYCTRLERNHDDVKVSVAAHLLYCGEFLMKCYRLEWASLFVFRYFFSIVGWFPLFQLNFSTSLSSHIAIAMLSRVFVKWKLILSYQSCLVSTKKVTSCRLRDRLKRAKMKRRQQQICWEFNKEKN